MNGSDLIVSVPDEFALGSGGRRRVLWCQLPLKSAMMDTEGLGVRRGAGTLDLQEQSSL